MHIYVPFNDEDLIHGATRMAGNDPVYVHGARGMSLRGIGRGTTLYLIAHGRYSRGDQICGEVPGYFKGKRYAYLTAVQLTKQLSKDGLPKDFGDLRLMVCWGGYMGGNQEWGDHTLRRDAAKAPFAGQLCSAMKAAGFTRIIVSGYTGAVKYPKKGRAANVAGIWLGTVDDRLVITDDTGDEALGDLAWATSTVADGGGVRTVYTLDNANRTVWH